MRTHGVRKPAVAGRFYSYVLKDLRKEIEACFTSKLGPGKVPGLTAKGAGPRTIKGLVVPHAGYMYSGPVAAFAYAALAKDGFPSTFIILGPNHSGMGPGVAVTMEDFATPLGNAICDEMLATAITKRPIEMGEAAHTYEHSLEVQLPFLQYFTNDFKFVPIAMMDQDHETAVDVGAVIRKAIEGRQGDVVIVASTDFSHYVPEAIAKKKDGLAIERILALDSKGLFETVKANRISMCGYGPVMVMLEALKGSANKADLLKYGTSGDVSAMDDVVGYAAITVR